LDVLRRACQLWQQPLDGDLAAGPGAVEGPRPHHLGHAALPERSEDLVVPEPCAGRPEDDLGLLHRFRSWLAFVRSSSAENRGSARTGPRSGSERRSFGDAKPRSIESPRLPSASSIRPSLACAQARLYDSSTSGAKARALS